ncbi:MAG: hypothetical protein ABI477_06775 [Chryseolinea sp.]
MLRLNKKLSDIPSYDLRSSSVPNIRRALGNSESEIEKSKTFRLGDVRECNPDSSKSTIILKWSTGDIRVISPMSQSVWAEKIIPFEIFVQVIDGSAEVTIHEKAFCLDMGQAIVIPANAGNFIKSNHRCKVLLVIIKSSYEQMIL